MPLASSYTYLRLCNILFRRRSTTFFLLVCIGWLVWWMSQQVVRNSCTIVQSNSTIGDLLYQIGRPDIGRVAGHFFRAYHVVYDDGVAYDIYSIKELGQLKPADEWLTFPLPNEKSTVKPWMPKLQPHQTFPVTPSPKTNTGLAYVDDVYVVTDLAFPDRINNIKHTFIRHNLPVNSIQWRHDQRNRSKCDGQIHEGVQHKILNLTPGPIGDATQQRYCAVTIHHVKIWHQIASSNATLSLVLEDDAIFVPFFKEKFDRFVYTAIRTGALKVNQAKCASPRANISANEWINQDPAFVIGACANLRDPSFPPENPHAPPLISAHKEKFSRCSHAYVLTRCSAQAMLRQMHVKKIPFHIIDWLQTYLGELSPTLQPFWLDPGIAYQGSQAADLAKVATFSKSMTQTNDR